MKQAVVLCAGRGSRLAPLTDEVPKVLIDVNGISILEHKFRMLDGLVDEVILVVGYLGEKVRRAFGDSYGSLRIRYVFQEKALGTGDAVLRAREFLEDRFIVLNGDDFYCAEDIRRLFSERFGVLGFEVRDARSFGVLELNEDGDLIGIEEKPERPKSNLVNVGAYSFDVSIFDKELEKSSRGEFEIVDYLTYLVERGEKVRVFGTSYWVAVNDFEELEIVRKVVEHINS